jgi:hypothetical protein
MRRLLLLNASSRRVSRANFFFDQGELLFKRRKMAFKAYANRLQGGVLDPARLGLDHVLEFGAPSHQGAKRSLLGPCRLVKLKIAVVPSVLGDQSRVDRIVLGVPSPEFGVSADSRSMGAMAIEAEF